MNLSEFEGVPNVEADHQSATIGSTAATLISLIGLHPRTKIVRIVTETAAIRSTVNGTPPTATLGSKYLPGTNITMSRATADQIQFIRGDAADATVQVIQFLR